ncbi:hypothetical protein D3C86_1279190 [compost metagenome]
MSSHVSSAQQSYKVVLFPGVSRDRDLLLNSQSVAFGVASRTVDGNFHYASRSSRTWVLSQIVLYKLLTGQDSYGDRSCTHRGLEPQSTKATSQRLTVNLELRDHTTTEQSHFGSITFVTQTSQQGRLVLRDVVGTHTATDQEHEVFCFVCRQVVTPPQLQPVDTVVGHLREVVLDRYVLLLNLVGSKVNDLCNSLPFVQRGVRCSLQLSRSQHFRQRLTLQTFRVSRSQASRSIEDLLVSVTVQQRRVSSLSRSVQFTEQRGVHRSYSRSTNLSSSYAVRVVLVG